MSTNLKKPAILLQVNPNFFSEDCSATTIFTEDNKYSIIDFVKITDASQGYRVLTLKKDEAMRWLSIKNVDEATEWYARLKFSGVNTEEYQKAFQLAYTLARELGECPLEKA